MQATAVIGLDFGTTFSGFAFARVDVPDDIRVEENWPFQQQATGSVYQKTKTCVLYLDGKLVSWGWGAETEALGLRRKEFKQRNAQLLERIKLCLSDDGEEAPTLPEGITTEAVIQFYLEGMSTLARQRYAEAYGDINPKDIRWYRVP